MFFTEWMVWGAVFTVLMSVLLGMGLTHYLVKRKIQSSEQIGVSEEMAGKDKTEDQIETQTDLQRSGDSGKRLTDTAFAMINCLGIIRGTVQVMEEEMDYRSDVLEYTRIIIEQVDRQNLLVRELLSTARREPAEEEGYARDHFSDCGGRTYALGAVTGTDSWRLQSGSRE